MILLQRHFWLLCNLQWCCFVSNYQKIVSRALPALRNSPSPVYTIVTRKKSAQVSHDQSKFLLFSVEKFFFERKIFNSVVGVFFLFLKLPMKRRVQVCRVGFFYEYKYRVSPRFGSRRWLVRIPLLNIFLRLFRYSLTRFYFLTTEKWDYLEKNVEFFGKWAF